MSVSKLDQTFDLVNRQRREALAQFRHDFPEVVAVYNSVGKYAGAAHDRPP